MDTIKKNVYKVSTISEYLNIIRDKELKEYIFRGQNEPFYGIEASLFRKYKGSWENDKIYNLEEIKEQYYKRVISRITLDERKNFLAFCQHHGIPTNLVDFSYSPLIALFFACYGKEEVKFKLSELIGRKSLNELQYDESAQSMLIHNLINRLNKDDISEYAEIYLIDKRRLIDITDIMLEGKCKNIFEGIMNNADIQNNIYNKIKCVFPKDKEIAVIWLDRILSCYELNNSTINGIEVFKEKGHDVNIINEYRQLIKKDIQNGIKKLYFYIKNNAFDDVNNNEFYLVQDFYGNLWSKEDNLDDFSDEEYCIICSKIYFELLINILKIFTQYKEKLILNIDIYFIYNCPNIFDRIANQKGLFIYQPYLYYAEDIYNYHIYISSA